MKENKVGDRFKWRDGYATLAEVIEWTDLGWFIIAGPYVGKMFADKDYPANNLNWVYLGNFSKSDNLVTLYSILYES